MVLTWLLITHKESSEVEIFAFYFLLSFQFQNCINASCGKKKTLEKEISYTLNHVNDVVNYRVCALNPTS